jgi:photosystem II stability/assembly factor-like uncharacterized protein
MIGFLFLSFNIAHSKERTWKRLLPESTFDICVNPKNPNTLVAGGLSRYIYFSYDAGKTWVRKFIKQPGGNEQLNNLLMFDSDTNVVLVGALNFGELSRTTDHGNTWEYVLQPGFPVATNGKAMVHYPKANSDTCYISELNGRFYRSTNQGASWDSIGRAVKVLKVTDEHGNTKDSLIYFQVGGIAIREDSANVVLIGSTIGEMYISTDGGSTWKFTDTLYTDKPSEIKDIELTFIKFTDRDPRVGYTIITYLYKDNTPNGGLWKTTDGGWSWEQYGFQDTSFWAVAARDIGGVDEIFVGGYTENYSFYDAVPGVCFVAGSYDGGHTWVDYSKDIDWVYWNNHVRGSIYDIDLFKNNKGIFVGDYGKIFKKGSSAGDFYAWNNYSQDSVNKLLTVEFIDDNTGIIGGDNGLLYKTTDEGAHWFSITSPTNESINDIKFIDNTTGFLAGSGGIIYKTVNTGDNWNKISTPTGWNLKEINFKSSIGLACGERGTILRSENSGNSWSKITLSTTENINSVSFRNENSAFAVGNNGSVFSTNDAGATWTKIDLNRTANLRKVVFNDENHGFIVGEKGTILKTSNGGNEWFDMPTNDLRKTFAIWFFNPSTGIAVGEYGMILKTTDAGYTWQKLYSRNFNTFYNVYFINDEIGFAVGDYSGISRTSNGGVRWGSVSYGKNSMRTIYFPTNNIGYCGGTNGYLVKSTDVGLTWTALNSNTTKAILSLHFIDENIGICCGADGTILRTNDGGANWTQINAEVDVNLNAVHYIDANTLLIAGDNGTLLKSNDGGLNWFELVKPTSKNLKKFLFEDSGRILCYGDDGIILTSNDATNFQVLANLDTYFDINGIVRTGENNYLAVGDSIITMFFRSTDNGYTWSRTISDSTKDFNDIAFLNNDTIFLAGDKRMIYYSTNGGDEWLLSLWEQPTSGLVWSLRYFGDKSNPKLYMATEAGLFVFDDTDPSDVDEFPVVTNQKLTLYKQGSELSFIYDNGNQPGNAIKARIANILGAVSEEKHFEKQMEFTEGSFDISKLAKGVYILQIIDGKESTSAKFIVE